MIGSLEIIIVLIAALFIFGPDKVPELARAAGKAFGDFKKAQISAELGVSDLDMYPQANSQKDTDCKIKEIAEASGIDVHGKSTDELLVLIEENVKTN
ncbi:twin-arginine translocase TatA/TatE family subunit [Methanolobus sp. ZRKC3]|uniref:Sec-independent protein translocase subunit TatA/TatB n=1 Tax=Methanolobus sp. ZRKC3 TaxID=3125786 RepID=UPI00324438A5